MTNGHTFYLPISEIDKPEYEHLKDGRWVSLWSDSFCMPVYGRWALNAFRSEYGVSLEPQRFSTTDPRPIGEHVVVEARINTLLSTDGKWVEISGSHLLGDNEIIQEGIVTVRIPISKPLKLEVTANG